MGIVPSMHIVMSIICLIINYHYPGSGTAISVFSGLCCYKPGREDPSAILWFNGLFGLCQWLCLYTHHTSNFGGNWACVWGVLMIIQSKEYHYPPPRNTVLPLYNDGRDGDISD